MKVESVAECSPWPALSDNWSWNQFFVFFLSGRLRQVLLYVQCMCTQFLVSSTQFVVQTKYLRLCPAKSTSWHVRPLKTQIRLHICTVWSESSISALWVGNGPSSNVSSIRELKDWSDCADTDRTCILCWIPAQFYLSENNQKCVAGYFLEEKYENYALKSWAKSVSQCLQFVCCLPILPARLDCYLPKQPACKHRWTFYSVDIIALEPLIGGFL